jgi:hypothetical protein
MTGEDYRKQRVGEILCAHNLWVSNIIPAKEWCFLTVIYPSPPGEPAMVIERLDDTSIRVDQDIISFDPDSRHAGSADFVVDVAAVRPD